ncbi:MAG TPA: hypothetical protein VFQ50_07035, partial [Flavobacterium sp.]|nr:hypothetical protein [Flavobacterium sp.]
MKKLLLSLFIVSALSTVDAQNVYNYGFSGTTADLTAAGWVRTNQSTAASTTTLWTVATYTSAVATTTNGGVFQDQAYAAGQTYPV